MLQIAFTTSNAAFDGDDRATEAARILREIADKIDGGADQGVIRDINGNPVGTFAFVEAR